MFDRLTGEPLFETEEVPFPASDVPGERLSPTQPIPVKPPPIDRVSVSEDYLIDFTPELRTQALEIMAQYRTGGLYEPPSLAEDPGGAYGTLHLPSSTGGPNWPGGAADPETGILYIYSKTEPTRLALGNNPRRSDMDFILLPSRNAPPTQVDGLPIFKPPWGRISAVDLNVGEILWQTPHGETLDNVRNHPALQGLDIPRTGQPGRVGVLVTKTLIIAGDGGPFTNDEGRTIAMLRAYDKVTGAEVGAVEIPAQQTGSPMTYAIDGVQYVVVSVSGGDIPGGWWFSALSLD